MWVVTVHECGGSTAEAIDVRASFGGFLAEREAKEFAEVLYENLTRITQQQGAYPDWFTQHFEVPEMSKIKLPQVTDPALLKQLDPEGKSREAGKLAIDMRKIAQKIIDDEEFEPLPPPAKDDEVAAAIASITGGSSGPA